MKFRWLQAPPQPLLSATLARTHNIPPLLAQCLINRGLNLPEPIGGFLQPRLRQLADPFLLPHMDRAVQRLFLARERREPVGIFGDYDVDGVTSTALLLEVLGGLGWITHYHLPHRMDEGYGLSRESVENFLHRIPAAVLLAVDCGSTAADTIRWLKERHVEVIVLDHHQIGNPPPEPVALVNPRNRVAGPLPGGAGEPQADNPTLNGKLQSESPIPASPARPSAGRAAARPCQAQAEGEVAPDFHELCSVGLAFKLAHALVKRGRETGLPGAADFDLRPLLDLVALGTIADIVPLTGENRILVSAGLARLNVTERPGLVALKKVARSPAPLGTYEAGFQLAPRLNAAGRLETAEEALRLLLARDLAEAMPLAEHLDNQNRERQAIERGIVDEVVASLRTTFNPETDFVIVEGRPPWHLGVVGIVASRVLREFYRPTVILGGDNPEWRGSGRSIDGFDLAAALRECGDLLVRHGGHAMAAGLSILPRNIDAFKCRLNEIARRTLTPEILQPPLRLDAEVGLDEITFEGMAHLNRLRPTGQGNPPAQFFARNLTHQRPVKRIGSNKSRAVGMKMWVTDGTRTHEAVWWGAGNEPLPVDRFDLAFVPQINHFNNQQFLQLKVLDWRPAAK